MKLVLVTDDFDPVGVEDGGWSVSESDSDDSSGDAQKGEKEEKQGKGKWARREEELVGSTKPVGDWLPVGFGQLGVVNVRVEML